MGKVVTLSLSFPERATAERPGVVWCEATGERTLRDLTAIVAAPADLHSGSSVGLMPPAWTRATGNQISQNSEQIILWQQWSECWHAVEALRLESSGWPRLVVIAHGDLVDGNHFGAAELITDRIDEQERLAVANLSYGLDLAGFDPARGDELRILSGTPVHVGESGSSEERIARQLLEHYGAPHKLDSAVIYQRLRRRICGVLIESAHHGPGPGARHWTRENPLTWKLKSEYLTRLERGESMPRFYLRAHRHQFVSAAPLRNQAGQIICEGFLLPSFTFKNGFAQKVAGDSLPNIGLWLGLLYADGRADWQCHLLQVPQEPIIED